MSLLVDVLVVCRKVVRDRQPSKHVEALHGALHENLLRFILMILREQALHVAGNHVTSQYEAYPPCEPLASAAGWSCASTGPHPAAS
jgi:hypothetical protein